MTTSESNLNVAYDYDEYVYYGNKVSITSPIDGTSNSHMLLTGMSGSAKSSCLLVIFGRLIQLEEQGIYYFADFKQDDMFEFLRRTKRYYPFKRCAEAVDVVYEILLKRQSGEDKTRYPVTLIFDEYVACILYLFEIDKKKAEIVMNKISTLLMLGRSLRIRVITTCQRPDASVFKNGSRLNFGIIIVLGASIKSIYEMLLPKEYIEAIGNRKFKTGEGVVLLQSSVLHFVKIPIIRNKDKLEELCVAGLSK